MKSDETIVCTSEEIKRQKKNGDTDLDSKNTLTKRTFKKEDTGKVAGYHNDLIIYPLDEAADIPDVIVKTLTGGFNAFESYLILMISNPRTSPGCTVFKDTFENPDMYDAIALSFNGEESPLRGEEQSLQLLKENYKAGGRESYEYLVNGIGEYSEELNNIPDGWLQAVELKDLDIREPSDLKDPMTVFGVDPSGGGNDNAAIIGRNNDYIKILKNQKYPAKDREGRKIAHELIAKDLDFLRMTYNPEVIYVDSFGVGADMLNYYQSKYKGNVRGYNIGNPIGVTGWDKTKYNSFRSQQIDKFLNWINPSEFGVEKAVLVGKRSDWIELTKILYKWENGRKTYIKKDEYKKLGIKSLNVIDACVHSMLSPVVNEKGEEKDKIKIPKRWKSKAQQEPEINYSDIC